ncbi:hypothetical protein EJC49_23900 [Aquibium carbonis]|uniref:C-type lysozyme inhibitor domain-containing protein n=1 Tax=Aquibium carbonis TaxID=2495581 RepID=A0A3S0A113_9HYPH|nr:hypothetical protein [Aquibium carbonis]RST81670.1 hypothetical protein EJC49_23900 [Aquibium carbonis]
MPLRAIILLPALALAACTSMAPALDEEIISSMTYDSTPCAELVARRDALASYHRIGADGALLVPGKRPFYVASGAGPFLPDTRLPWTRDRSRAIGVIAAMDGSIKRRQCRAA